MGKQAGDAVREFHSIPPTKNKAADNNSSKRIAAASRNVFLGMLASTSLPEYDKSQDRIAQDGFVVLAAGGETTSRVLNTATYHLLANKCTILQN